MTHLIHLCKHICNLSFGGSGSSFVVLLLLNCKIRLTKTCDSISILLFLLEQIERNCVRYQRFFVCLRARAIRRMREKTYPTTNTVKLYIWRKRSLRLTKRCVPTDFSSCNSDEVQCKLMYWTSVTKKLICTKKLISMIKLIRGGLPWTRR